MKGIELARAYWESCGAEMIDREFPDIRDRIAAALTGPGSECFGFDDETSRDHDFEPGFCLFLPGEDEIDRQTAFRLERAYAKLPAEFRGFRRQQLGPVGGRRHGVFRLEDYFEEKLGCPPAEMSLREWLSLPQYVLAEAVNGEVFRDPSGRLTAIREALGRMPEDARRKRLAGQILLMGQSGQYNYPRCLKHGESGAAQMAAFLFVRAAMETVFLLHRTYMPYYKWAFRALRALPGGEDLARTLEWLISTDNAESLREDKAYAMEGIAAEVMEALERQGLTKAACGDLEKHAYSVNDGIRDGEVRNLHILAAVTE